MVLKIDNFIVQNAAHNLIDTISFAHYENNKRKEIKLKQTKPHYLSIFVSICQAHSENIVVGHGVADFQ